MKYCTRTVTWKFKESNELSSEFTSIKSVTVTCPKDIFNHYQALFSNQVRERFIVFWLSSANRVLGFEIISEGILNASLCHPREIFRGAIVATAASIIVAHNHPSGNTDPSAEDIRVTKQIVESGNILGISVHDHIIFADTSYSSFAEQGRL